MTGMNWSENIRYEASELRAPSSVEELQEIVASAPHVKALGTRHSFNRVADTPGGVQVTTADLGLEVTVDREQMTATVPGGWSYSTVAAQLQDHGVALRNLGSLPHISVAGATATGTHGSGDTNQGLAAEISGLEFVTADGSLQHFDRSSPQFAAMPVGLGAFGIITRITLDVIPTYLVRQDQYRGASWETVLENLDEIMASAYSVNLHAGYSETHTRTIWQKSLVETDASGSAIDHDVPDELWGAPRLDVVELDPGRVTTLTVPGPWSERLAHFVPEGAPSAGGDELQTEYFVSRSDAVAAINVLRQMGEKIDPHLHGTEIRTVAADDLWLSPSVGRDCLSLGFTWKKHPTEVLALLPEIEARLAPFKPTPHWGKLFAMGRDELVERFDRLDDFLELAHAMDPRGTFSNPYLRRLAA